MRRLPPLREAFAARFARPCTVVTRAPGRVNLIGEHTDYNEGFVLPIALEQCTWVAAALREDGLFRAYSASLDAEAQWPIDGWQQDRMPHWTAYLAGAAVLLSERGASLRGCDLALYSDVPVGGGLSSSAALEVATASALAALAGFPIHGRDLADLCHAVEHDFAGVPCGIMDQYVSVLAEPGCAFLLDCRTRSWEHLPLALRDHAIVVIDSGVKHSLRTGAYAQRRAECDDAAAYFRAVDPGVRALRDVPVELVCRHANRVQPHIARRATHVTTENARTLAARDALRDGDLRALGMLLSASHASLRDDYEVSCRELDRLVELISQVDGVLGARMTGGGFGGCVVALLRESALPRVERAIRTRYDGEGLGPATLLPVHPGAGCRIAYHAEVPA